MANGESESHCHGESVPFAVAGASPLKPQELMLSGAEELAAVDALEEVAAVAGRAYCAGQFELVCISYNTITAVAACAARLAVAIPSRRVGAGYVRLREDWGLAAAIPSPR